MIAQTLGFWRRLVGKETAPGSDSSGSPANKEDNRRFWVRYPADLGTSVQLADHPGEDRIPARIRDISRGGVNLLIDTPFEAGQLLSLELPSAEDANRIFNLLACVVRTRSEPNGRYSLGCVFSRELTEEDLFSFGARRVRHAPEDQRTWMRFPCQLTAKYNKVGEPDDVASAAEVINISASGVGLAVKSVVDVGSLLNLHVIGKQGHERTLLACVVHAVKQGDHAPEEANWQLGCNFIRELSQSDFQDLM